MLSDREKMLKIWRESADLDPWTLPGPYWQWHLKRMCSPSRYSDMVHLFAKRVPVISMITNEVLDFIYATHGHRIQQWNHQLLNPRNLEHYADSVYIREHPLITASGVSTGLFGLFLGQNATKELSTTGIDVSTPWNFSQS